MWIVSHLASLKSMENNQSWSNFGLKPAIEFLYTLNYSISLSASKGPVKQMPLGLWLKYNSRFFQSSNRYPEFPDPHRWNSASHSFCYSKDTKVRHTDYDCGGDLRLSWTQQLCVEYITIAQSKRKTIIKGYVRSNCCKGITTFEWYCLKMKVLLEGKEEMYPKEAFFVEGVFLF